MVSQGEEGLGFRTWDLWLTYTLFGPTVAAAVLKFHGPPSSLLQNQECIMTSSMRMMSSCALRTPSFPGGDWCCCHQQKNWSMEYLALCPGLCHFRLHQVLQAIKAGWGLWTRL